MKSSKAFGPVAQLMENYMDQTEEKRLLDTAVLITTLAFANDVPEGVTVKGDFITIRNGKDVHVLAMAHKWTRQLLKTIGTNAFAVAVIHGAQPQTFGRGYAHLSLFKSGAPKLLHYYVAQRVYHAFRRDRTARMRMNVSTAVRLPAMYGSTANKLGRVEYGELRT